MVERLVLALGVTALLFTLTACSDDGGGGGSGSTGTEPPIPAIDARCEEIQTAIDYFGAEHVFRAQVDNFLALSGTPAEDAPPHIRSEAALANRALWSLCAFDAPQYVEEIAADSPPDDSAEAGAFRDDMSSQDIHRFDEATDNGLDILGGYICNLAEPLQPISTAEITDVIAAELIDRYGGMDTLEAGKVFFFAVSLYCPDLDLSGGTGLPGATGEDVLNRSDLEQAIGDRLAGLIQAQQLPYVIAQGPSFIETTKEQAAGTDLPAGTWLDIGFAFPIQAPSSESVQDELELSVYGPLELYAEAVRPYFAQMDFVDMYWLPWLDSDGSVVSAFNIYPEQMRQYLDGDISVEQFADKIRIYSP